jgi:CheY-like chemotaxis protein
MNERAFPLRVLWLEDSDDDVFFLKNALKKSGLPITLQHVWNGQEGLDLLRKQDFPRPDAILTDIRMPRMDGLTFAKEIRRDARFVSTPIFVLSTSGLSRDVQMGLSLGIAGHFTKPATPTDWINRLNEIYDAMVRHVVPKASPAAFSQTAAQFA